MLARFVRADEVRVGDIVYHDGIGYKVIISGPAYEYDPESSWRIVIDDYRNNGRHFLPDTLILIGREDA